MKFQKVNLILIIDIVLQAESDEVFSKSIDYPPSCSMREHVVVASKAMRNGDGRKARDFIINEKMNGKVISIVSDNIFYEIYTIFYYFLPIVASAG